MSAAVRGSDEGWLGRISHRRKERESNSGLMGESTLPFTAVVADSTATASTGSDSMFRRVRGLSRRKNMLSNGSSHSDISLHSQHGSGPVSRTVKVVTRDDHRGGLEGADAIDTNALPRHYSDLTTLVCVILCAAVFFCASRLGLLITVGAVSLFWIGNAMCVVFFIYAPLIEWPLYICGIMAGFYLAILSINPDATEGVLIFKLGIADAIEILMISTFLKWKLGRDLYDPYVVEKESLVLDLILFPSIIAPCLVACFAAWAIVSAYPELIDFYTTWVFWFAGDFSGNYFTLYTILVARCTLHDTPRTRAGWRELKARITYRHYFKLVEYLMCLLLLSAIFVGSGPFFVVLIMFPIQAWVAMRFPQALSAFVNLWIGAMIAVSLKVEQQLWGVTEKQLITPPVDTNIIISVHLTIFVSVFCSQFVSTNITAKDKAIKGMRLAAKEKESFFQHVTHEFRTPLSVVLGFSHELLQRDIEDPEVVEAIQHINSACTVLSATVDDMLEIFKLKVGSVKLVENPTSMSNFLSECHHVLNKYADSLHKELNINVQLASDVPEVLVVANSRLAQLVLNLGSNAIKYTRDGGTVLVSLSVENMHKSHTKGMHNKINNKQHTTDMHMHDIETGKHSTADREGVEMFLRHAQPGDEVEEDCIHSTHTKDGNDCHTQSIDVSVKHGVEVCVSALHKKSGDSPTSTSARQDFAPLRQDFAPLRQDLAPPRQEFAPPRQVQNVRQSSYASTSSGTGSDSCYVNNKVHEQRGTPNMFLVLTVSDTGVGIPSALLDTVFERFNRCDGYANATMAQGTGLGLTVTKQVVELMKGELYVTSTYGLGSTFVVTIPVKEPVKHAHEEHTHISHDTQKQEQSGSEPALHTQVVPETVPPLSILVVEDQLLNQKLLRAGLVRMGHTVEIACNGRVALEMSTAPGAAYDVMLLDLGLPEMSGDQVLQRLRASSPPQSHVPILVTSAEVMSTESTDALIEKGADGMVPKPYTAATLEAGLKYLIAIGRLQLPNRAPGDVAAST